MLRMPLFGLAYGLLLFTLWHNRAYPGLALAFVGVAQQRPRDHGQRRPDARLDGRLRGAGLTGHSTRSCTCRSATLAASSSSASGRSRTSSRSRSRHSRTSRRSATCSSPPACLLPVRDPAHGLPEAREAIDAAKAARSTGTGAARRRPAQRPTAGRPATARLCRRGPPRRSKAGGRGGNRAAPAEPDPVPARRVGQRRRPRQAPACARPRGDSGPRAAADPRRRQRRHGRIPL